MPGGNRFSGEAFSTAEQEPSCKEAPSKGDVMRFDSKPYFLLGALVVAASAPSQSGSSGSDRGQADEYPASRASEAAPADDAARDRVEEGSEQRARYDRSASEAQPASRGDRKSTAADDLAADPFVRQTWSGP
jgi:hypothetical protein